MSDETPPNPPQAVQRPAFIESLFDPSCYDHEVGEIRIEETHISWILLTGHFAYKIKKPVRLSFLDFSTLELRRLDCEEELRLNRRLAEAIYLAVVPIGGSEQAPRIGRAPAFEYAVKMRQFDSNARLDKLLARGQVDLAAIVSLAERVAVFHLNLPPAGDLVPSADLQLANVLNNQAEIEAFVKDPRCTEKLLAVRVFIENESRRLRPLIEERSKTAAYKDGHGDLHLENLVYIDKEILPFDALEFNPSLRCIDTVSEIAFLAMDLLARNAGELAYAFLNRYFEIGGDYLGLALLRYYLVYRATVRAKVRAIRESQGQPSNLEPDKRPYLDLAAALAARRRPLLVLMHGMSGSGKTFASSRLIGDLQAIRIRSDLERKRLHGLAPRDASGSGVGEGLYGQEQTIATYERLADCARAGVENGIHIVVDATFATRAQRAPFFELAHRFGAEIKILHCKAPIDTLRQRIEARAADGIDASEATADVLDDQLTGFEPLTPEETAHALDIDTAAAGSIDTAVAELLGSGDWQSR